MRKLLFLVLFCLSAWSCTASHVVGGDITYRWLGNNNYEITLEIFRDCINGNPSALDNDDPASISIYEGFSFIFVDSFINANFSVIVPPNFSNECVVNIPLTCLSKLVFKRVVNLPPSNQPYTIIYQRCCRNESINNIQNPGGTGTTYSCVIPPFGIANFNNSSVYKNDPPQIICVNNPLRYDNSAIDVDGDSLSYELCDAFEGGSETQFKPTFLGSILPVIGSVDYVTPFSAQNPISGNPFIQLDPKTGLLTGTPNLLGRFVVNVCCHEWRNGIKINTNKREFQFVITDCSKAVLAIIPQLSADVNTYQVNCKSRTVNFINQSVGGFAYVWDFGVLTSNNDTSSLFEPTYTYPDTGVYVVSLIINPNSTCPDSIKRFVKIFPFFNGDFVYNGLLCPETPISFTDKSTATYQPINFWKWDFNDGSPIATDQNPIHVFPNIGKNFKVTLISGNGKGCRDTSSEMLQIPKVNVFAGLDTVIVKNKNLQLIGNGAQTYSWSPSTYLNNSSVFNPIANFPNKGLYPLELRGITANGCIGIDTIEVTVADVPYLNIPTAFSPNADGNNDVFKILNAGFSKLNFFKIYNRWGKQVYSSNNFREGWDGFYNQRLAEMGTYFYWISVIDPLGKDVRFKGDITLIY
jgi:gliding motility-associated-like protein